TFQFLNQAVILLAGTAEAGAFYSSNLGTTWQAIAPQGTIIKNITGFSTIVNPRADNMLLMSTAGSGIFRLVQVERDRQLVLEWEPVQSNPSDLVVRCLLRNGTELLAGTEKGGIFRSIDDGNVWAARNAGLTMEDAQINPNQQVNFDVRSLLQFKNQILAAGMGTLISPDGLYSKPIKAGDRLQLMAPPQPILNFAIEPPAPQKWLLQNADGFIGHFITLHPSTLELQPAAPKDPIVSELATIALPPLDEQLPILTLMEPLKNAYDPAKVNISANVVMASHGETVVEVLGSGDGTQTHQRFTLQQPPLTYTAAATATGSQSSLQVRVNDLLWQEVASLYDRKSQETLYITRTADDGTTTLLFGDGESGARLPSGVENMTATYRMGLGRIGQLKARQLSQLKTRPLGISDVINPLPATGAADPETLLEARESAPRTVRTLDRIVSLQDYEDFARAFTGIGKAQAVVLWAGELQQVQITVAGLEGDAVLPDSRLYDSLVQAIDAARDPIQQVQVDSYEPIRFNLKARLLIDSRYQSDKVLKSVEFELLNQFNFEKRAFAQPVTASEVIATIQAIPGVIAVDLDALHRLDRPLSLEQVLPALSARWQATSQDILPAQLLLLNPAGIDLRTEVIL
ncbi:MAG: putative baseplate assembly protein, partial [Synechococcales bacterium]|nr:putative baseplate assembly protein [Synechococcales bacterium]